MLRETVVFLVMFTGCSSRNPLPRRAHRDVWTTQGLARGYLVSQPPHYVFLGLPYARPPARHRFKAPEPPPTWDGVFEATHRIMCPQSGDSEEGDENCLVVNVFAPESAAPCCMLPVMMVVHDGGWQTGCGSHYPPARLLKQGFVVVTFNYRLGVFGFLCLGTKDAPGNAGLRDQIAALYWVHKNIGNFGGNPYHITLYGTGSGAAAVELLLLTGMTETFVKQVILESGSALSPATVAYEPYTTALNIAVTLGFDDQGSANELERFYQGLTKKELISISDKFIPCIENRKCGLSSFLGRDPLDILQQGDFHKVPMIVVYANAAEVSVIEQTFDTRAFKEMLRHFVDLMPNNLEFEWERKKYKVSKMVEEFYFEGQENSRNLMQNFVDYVNDVLMEYPVIKFASMYAAKSNYPVYVLKFMYNKNSLVAGASHNDFFKHIFSKPGKLSEEDEMISNILTKLMNNFIKTGDPTPLTSSLVPVIWQPVNYEDTKNGTDLSKTNCLVFGSRLHMSVPQTSQSLVFWDHLYARFYRTHVFDGQVDTEETVFAKQ